MKPPPIVEDTANAVASLKALEVRDAHDDMISRQLARPPTLEVARVFEALRNAALACDPAQNGMARIPLEMLIEAYGHMVDMERKLTPELWSEQERAAWAQPAGTENYRFERLRAAKG